MLNTEPDPADEGFSLIELLVAVSILGIIMLALVGTMFTMLTTQRTTQQRLAGSHDAQIAAAYFNNDAQGAGAVVLGGPAGCGSAAAALVRFDGNDFDEGATTAISRTTSWVWGAGQLQRLYCRGTSTPVTTVVARDLAAAPVVIGSCDGTATPTTTGPVIGLKLTGHDGSTVLLCAHRRTA